jgi:hypothetical protein
MEATAMTKPQQPEIRRSSHTPVDTGQHAKEVAGAAPGDQGSAGPVPEGSRPGHHPDREQDKPDVARFLERLAGRHAPDREDA